MKNVIQINKAKELVKKAQDYVIIAQASLKVKEAKNKDELSDMLDKLTAEIKNISEML